MKQPYSQSLSLLWRVNQHWEPDINTWSGSKAPCSYPAPPAGQGSFTEEWEKRQHDGKDQNKCCPQAWAGLLCPESQQEVLGCAQSASGGTGRARRGFISKYPKQKMKIKMPIELLRDVLVWEKVLFVCRVPLGPKCVKSHVRQYEAAQHLPQALASPIFHSVSTEQSHSWSLRRH